MRENIRESIYKLKKTYKNNNLNFDLINFTYFLLN